MARETDVRLQILQFRSGIEMIQMLRKRQMRGAEVASLSIAEQLEMLVATI